MDVGFIEQSLYCSVINAVFKNTQVVLCCSAVCVCCVCVCVCVCVCCEWWCLSSPVVLSVYRSTERYVVGLLSTWLVVKGSLAA